MDVAVWSLEILCTVNEAFWIYMLMDMLFERKDRFEKHNSIGKYFIPWFPIAIYVILITALNQITLTSPYTFVIAMIFNVIVAIIIWKNDLIMASAIVGTYGLIILVKDLFVMFAVRKIGGEGLLQKAAFESGFERLCILGICGAILFIVSLFIYIWLGKINKEKNNIRYLAVVCAASYIGLLFLGAQILTNFVVKLDIVMIVVMGIISACVTIPYFLLRYKDMVNQLRVVETRNELLVKNYDAISEYYIANAKLYHDMKHHLNVINHMLQNSENDEVKEYIHSLGEFTERYNKKSYTGVDIIDVILSEKEKNAVGKGIEFNVKTQILPYDIGIDKKDLCAVFANILDNALEAAEKEINVKVKISKQMLIIQVKNDCKNKPKKKNGYYQTTKKNSLYHGWGLRSVESVVEKYDGIMDCQIENQMFIVNIIMNF